MITKKLQIHNDQEALLLLGEQDVHLRQTEREYRVEIFLRHDPQQEGLNLSIRGAVSRVEKAWRHLKNRLEKVRSGESPEKSRSTLSAFPEQSAPALPKDSVYVSAYGKIIKPRSPKQKAYVEAIETKDMVFGIGPAGTGKTYLAVACALRALKAHQVSRIVLTRPVVEAGEKLGFLPGDLYEKVHPYLKPLYDAFYGLMGPDKFRVWREDEVVEIVPLAYMRGRTLDEAFVILDEAQNTTPEQMKMFLTRMGIGSKVVVTGDLTQIDIPNKSQSGLLQAKEILSHIDSIAFIHFGEEDVVRHELVKKVLRAYERHEKR